MGYDTYHSGDYSLNKEPNEIVKKFFETYDLKNADIENDPNCDLWSLSRFTEGGSTKWCIEREECTRHSEAADGLQFIIDHVLIPNGLVINGVVYWSGEESGDLGKVVVRNNKITIYYAHIIYKDDNGIPEPDSVYDNQCIVSGDNKEGMIANA